MIKECNPYVSALELVELMPVGKWFFAESLNVEITPKQLRIRMKQLDLRENKVKVNGKTAFEYFASQKDKGRILTEISSSLKRSAKAAPAKPTKEDKLFNLFMEA